MAPSFNISKLLGGVSGPVGRSRLGASTPVSYGVPRGVIRLRDVDDISGTVKRHVDAIADARRYLLGRVLADPVLRERLVLGATEMSGQVVSTPYMKPADFRPPGLVAGSYSPHATMLRSALQADAQHIVPVAATVHVIKCDGLVSGETLDPEEVLAEYRAAQERDPNFHVFVVELGDARRGEINTDFTRRLSLRHEAIGRANVGQAFADAAAAIFNLLAVAVREPSGDVSRVIGRSASLDMLHGRDVESGL